MNKFKSLIRATAVAATLASAMGVAQAANVTFYASAAQLAAAIGGPTATQTFEGFAAGTNLLGVQVLPGVTMSTNLAGMSVADIAGIGKAANLSVRDKPASWFDINIAGGNKAFGFEVNSMAPNTGTAFIDFFFADGDTTFTRIPVLPQATENTAQFFGIISDKAITKIRWEEGALANNSCCEPTVMDNFITAAPVPEPTTGVMLMAGLAATGWLARRRRTAV
jgi:PEP-CTERM motif